MPRAYLVRKVADMGTLLIRNARLVATMDAELREMRESEMWQAGAAVRALRPESWEK